jgi:hypothetical protein
MRISPTMNSRLLTAALALTLVPTVFAQSYLLRAREQVITASVHRDNCIVVKPDGTFHIEQSDQKEQPKPDVYTGKLDAAQLDKLKQSLDNPALEKLGSVHQGQRGTAEGARVEIRNMSIARKSRSQSIGITQSDDNPPMPGPLQPVVDWVDNQFAANLPPDKAAHADHCGGTGRVYVPEAPGSAKHLK